MKTTIKLIFILLGINSYVISAQTNFNQGIRLENGTNVNFQAYAVSPLDAGDIVFTKYNNQEMARIRSEYDGTNDGASIVFSTTSSIKDTFNFSSTGNLGIGIPAPAYKLDVLGSIGLGSESVNANTTKVFLRNPAGKTWAISSGANMVTESSFSIYNWTDNQNSPYFHIDINGNIGIGTFAPDTKLAVNGTIHTKEVKVDLQSPMSVPDYVFANDYKLRSLKEVEIYIKENKHLPEIPSAKEIEKNGLMLAEMNMGLLKKIEELTLYSIQQNKKIEAQNKEIQSLKELVLRVTKLENELARK
ncbi:hypothetical protein D3C87_1155490 [compost metagenome]